MANVEIKPVTIKPQIPALSRAGRRLALLSIPWFFVSLVILDALGPADRDAAQALRWLSLLVAAAPFGALILHPWLGRLTGLRWLHHQMQPRLVIDANGLDLQLPNVGRRVYDWSEVEGLRMRPDRGADLIGTDGVALAKIPESMVLAGGTRWRSESIASVVARSRPDRYRLTRANWAGEPIEFSLRTSGEPAAADRWARRSRLVNVGLAFVSLAIVGYFLFRSLAS